ncbi:response regulator [Methylorubrum populi]|uniref:response regulator n=1 Tax=Methylorubrum populi TaxID=223967 RepID=UPI001645E46B|nr:response regulator [Methylorubrum populi]
MRVLVIEDEQHKVSDLTEQLAKLGAAADDVVIVGGVREAVLVASESNFNLIVLDMALPTFAGRGADGSGGGTAQAIGGLEVLRMLKTLGKRVSIIIVTQYPEIIVDGRKVKLNQAGRVLSSKYEQNVLGAVLYSYSTAGWAQQFGTLVRRVS